MDAADRVRKKERFLLLLLFIECVQVNSCHVAMCLCACCVLVVSFRVLLCVLLLVLVPIIKGLQVNCELARQQPDLSFSTLFFVFVFVFAN